MATIRASFHPRLELPDTQTCCRAALSIFPSQKTWRKQTRTPNRRFRPLPGLADPWPGGVAQAHLSPHAAKASCDPPPSEAKHELPTGDASRMTSCPSASAVLSSLGDGTFRRAPGDASCASLSLSTSDLPAPAGDEARPTSSAPQDAAGSCSCAAGPSVQAPGTDAGHKIAVWPRAAHKALPRCQPMAFMADASRSMRQPVRRHECLHACAKGQT